jgi:adenine-specific DNA-methyltransferase
MDKLKMKTKSKVDVNIEVIGKLFPDTITEVIKGYDEKGNPIYEMAIDFDMLKQELSKVIVEGKQERYQMNWPGKKEAILEANSPINKTLRPCREESVDFDKTENLYIEGDNLDVLKLLQETYLNKVKMIYIDPPYNTGNDSFVYPDNFAMDGDEFSEASGQYDEDGNMNYDIRKNGESNGKFHSDWLNMMYPRLKLAKDLLSDEGVIFISIDDNELHDLRKMCDEVFGERSFVATFIWEKRLTRENRRTISVRHDYIVTYAKNGYNVSNSIGLLPMDQSAIERYKNPDEDYRGIWTSVPAIAQAGHGTKNQFYTLITPSGREIDPPSGSCWRYTKEKMEQAIKDNRIWFGGNGNGVPRIKKFLNEGKQGLTPETMWMATNVGTNDSAKRELTNLFDGYAVFETPKPIDLIKQMVQINLSDDKADIIMDFFSGSATTAHAVMQLNAEDGGNRKFIMVQIPEPCDEKSEAYRAGYKNICEIGKERIRRAGKKIREEHPDKSEKLDTGFRVLKVDSSNMKDVFYNPGEYKQTLLDNVENNIKEDRSGEDLLFQVMLDLGELLSSDIQEIEIEGKKVFNVGQGDIIACFDENITDEVVTKIAKMKPLYAVFRDSSLINDAVATNFEQIFKTYSPNTIRKVL